MTKAVLLHREDSVYEDVPEERYQFPLQYLERMKATVGDDVVYYETAKAGGARGYKGIAKVAKIISDPNNTNLFLALIEPGSYLPFPKVVPIRDAQGLFESTIADAQGNMSSGHRINAVRLIEDFDFNRIVDAALSASNVLPRIDSAESILTTQPTGMEDKGTAFDFDYGRPSQETVVSRPVRDRFFRASVIDAYGARCAFSGFKLINGGGRAEAEAAHIIPVASGGSDSVRNGLALCGTAHWMFDRGLLSLEDDGEILVSRQANNRDEIDRILLPDRRALLPDVVSLRPRPANLNWHRTHCFKH